MIQNPKNCRNNCRKYQTSDCPAIEFEQKEHMHGFSNLVITVTPVIGCDAYLEPEPVRETQPTAKKKK
jgi:hypothetical protein